MEEKGRNVTEEEAMNKLVTFYHLSFLTGFIVS